MARQTLYIFGLGILLAVVAAHADAGRVTAETALRESPTGGAELGLLTAGAPLMELERRGDWVRVRVEGWVPASSLTPSAPSSPASAPAVPAAAAAAGGRASLEGTLTVRVSGGMFKKTLTGKGQQVWLLPASVDLEAAGAVTPADEARLKELDAEAARLAKEAGRALKKSNFTEATMRHDELMAERRKVLDDRAAILATYHGRREATARREALSTAVCDSRGFFTFPEIAPGSYRIYARLVDRALDLEWIEPVEMGASGVRIELDETRARGLLETSGG